MEFLVDFMYQFAEENSWEDGYIPEQLRSFFTTWAFLAKVEADTKLCDYVLHNLYQYVNTQLISQEEFEEFMLKFIV
ncbi:hypothetical protein [Monoglobus pectinilyticus]|uniref:hypothetical protein n=1 Tax=Monoglobus pectinilyticus TaxID=1981510 RepID=UPI002A85C1A7|nr:hypothetical protein [Eubacterium sp.]